MDWYDGKPYMIRRSRGYAPLPFFYGRGSGKDVLAMGGELKNCFCIGRNNLFYPSPYIGDMADIRTVEALRRTPVENLFAETDESDVPIEEIYRRIAQAKDLDPELLKCAIYRNYREIFER